MAKELVSVESVRTLSAEQFQASADVPPELEWLANITDLRPRDAYCEGAGVVRPCECFHNAPL